MTDTFVQAQAEWLSRVALAEKMIPLIGKLYREHNVVTSIHGKRLINLSAIEIIKAHRYARKVNDVELELEKTLPILERLVAMDLGTASIDVGQLTLDAAVTAATAALSGPDRQLRADDLEVAVLSRSNGRRCFRRLSDLEVTGLLGS